VQGTFTHCRPSGAHFTPILAIKKTPSKDSRATYVRNISYFIHRQSIQLTLQPTLHPRLYPCGHICILLPKWDPPQTHIGYKRSSRTHMRTINPYAPGNYQVGPICTCLTRKTDQKDWSLMRLEMQTSMLRFLWRVTNLLHPIGFFLIWFDVAPSAGQL